MSEEDPNNIRRVIVLVDDSTDSQAALEAAARFAAREGAQLEALFVEDVNLLRSAALPFAREIGLTSATSRPMDTGAIENRLRLQAERAQQLLERISRRLSIPASFRVSRGDVEREALGSAQSGDLLVVCRAGGQRRGGSRLSDRDNRIAAGAHCTVMFVGDRQPEEHRPVLVLYANSQRGRRSLALAAAMARDVDRRLVLLLPPGTDKQHAHLRESAQQWAASHDIRLSFQTLARTDAGSLIAVLRREGGQSLVLPRDSAALRDPLGRYLLDEIDAPVVVVP